MVSAVTRALKRNTRGQFIYASDKGPDQPRKGQFARKADIVAYRAVQRANGRKGAAATIARKARFTKATQTLSDNAGISATEAQRRIKDYLSDYFEAKEKGEELPDFGKTVGSP